MRTRILRSLGAAGLLVLAAACSSPAPPAALTPAAPAPPSSAGSASTTPQRDERPAGKCVLADLGVELSAPAGGSNQRTVRVIWTNTSSSPCTMTGFGGADLVASPRSEERYSLPRADREPATVRLDPGGRAHSTITYLPTPATGGGYRATQLLATPPDETHAAVLRWTEGPVTDQRSATRPGTFLSPVQAGAS